MEFQLILFFILAILAFSHKLPLIHNCAEKDGLDSDKLDLIVGACWSFLVVGGFMVMVGKQEENNFLMACGFAVCILDTVLSLYYINKQLPPAGKRVGTDAEEANRKIALLEEEIRELKSQAHSDSDEKTGQQTQEANETQEVKTAQEAQETQEAKATKDPSE